MGRRGRELRPAEEQMLRALFAATADERGAAASAAGEGAARTDG